MSSASVAVTVCAASEVSDDVVLHVVELMLRLSTLSSAIKTATHQLLLVSACI